MNTKKKIKIIITNTLNLPLPYSLDNRNKTFITKSLQEYFVKSKCVYCNINFDDQSPVYGELEGKDYGGNINKGLTRDFEVFLRKNPQVAITSFVIPNFMGNTNKFKNQFKLTNQKYSKWVAYYSRLAKNYNIEYAIHGLFHNQKENPFFQKYTEFAFKNQKETLETIIESINIFNAINWPVTGFRQPGWDISSIIDLPGIAKQVGLKYIASNSYYAGFNAGGIERVSNYYPTIINGVVNFPQNIELDWPLDKIKGMIDFLVKKKALISIKAHFVNKNSPNCLNISNLKKLEETISYIKDKYDNDICFSTLSEITKKITYQWENL